MRVRWQVKDSHSLGYLPTQTDPLSATEAALLVFGLALVLTLLMEPSYKDHYLSPFSCMRSFLYHGGISRVIQWKNQYLQGVIHKWLHIL